VIISHEHRFVFVKTRKTAGTSIEVFLSRLAGEDAVVTPVDPPVEGHVARNYERPDDLLHALQWRLHTRGDTTRPCYKNHLPAGGIRRRLGRRRFDGYFTFCFERNPWDKVVSEYFWVRGRGGFDGSLRDFVLRRTPTSDFGLYSLDGTTVGVDFVGRYEQLGDDLRTALERVGLGDHEVTLTREKGNYRPATDDAGAQFDDEMDARIEHVFAREIRTFGYTRPAHLST
jgi:hypothetical protein